MITKEVNEIKKLIKQNDDSTIKLCGCYVSGDEKEKLTYLNTYLTNLPESDQHKFIEIIRKTLSGTLGKNLLNLNFTKEASEEGGQQRSLVGLLETEFNSTEALEVFYDHIIENFDFLGNFLILLIYDTYDIPVKTKDEIKMNDSTEIYKYMICSICPVNLSKAGLSYHEDTNSIENRVRDWVVDMPCAGFLFPAFNNRSTDIYSLLYYIKNTKEMYNYFIEHGLGCYEEIPSDCQKTIFNEIIEDIVINQPDYEIVDVVRDINENLSGLIENNTSDEPVKLGREDIKSLFRDSGVKEEHLEKVDRKFEEDFEDNMLFNAESIREKKKFEVKTNDVIINVKPENSHIVEIKVIDGIKCLVIPMDRDVEINGIMSRVREELENANN